MLGFKRVCVDAWQAFVRLPCNALQFALQVYSKFFVGRRNAFNTVNLSLPHFALFAGSNAIRFGACLRRYRLIIPTMKWSW